MKNQRKARSRLRRFFSKVDPARALEGILWSGWPILLAMVTAAAVLVVFSERYLTLQSAMMLPLSVGGACFALVCGARMFGRRIVLRMRYGGVRYRAECLSAWLIAGGLREVSLGLSDTMERQLVVRTPLYRFVRTYRADGAMSDEGRITPEIQSLFEGYMDRVSDIGRLIRKLEADPRLDIGYRTSEVHIKRSETFTALAAKAK